MLFWRCFSGWAAYIGSSIQCSDMCSRYFVVVFERCSSSFTVAFLSRASVRFILVGYTYWLLASLVGYSWEHKGSITALLFALAWEHSFNRALHTLSCHMRPWSSTVLHGRCFWVLGLQGSFRTSPYMTIKQMRKIWCELIFDEGLRSVAYVL